MYAPYAHRFEGRKIKSYSKLMNWYHIPSVYNFPFTLINVCLYVGDKILQRNLQHLTFISGTPAFSRSSNTIFEFESASANLYIEGEGKRKGCFFSSSNRILSRVRSSILYEKKKGIKKKFILTSNKEDPNAGILTFIS